MQVLNNISRLNGRPRSPQEAKEYAKALSTIEKFDTFNASILAKNQGSDDLDTSEAGVALEESAVRYDDTGAYVTGALSTGTTATGEPEVDLVQANLSIRGYPSQYTFTKTPEKTVYIHSGMGQELKVVHDHNSGTLSMFLNSGDE